MTDPIQKPNAPYAVASLVLGICSLLFGCWGAGLVCGIIGLVLSKKGFAAYNETPGQYAGFGMLNAGKIMSIIGIVSGALSIVFWIIYVAIVGMSLLFVAAAQA